jgi:hypothetical protein
MRRLSTPGQLKLDVSSGVALSEMAGINQYYCTGNRKIQYSHVRPWATIGHQFDRFSHGRVSSVQDIGSTQAICRPVARPRPFRLASRLAIPVEEQLSLMFAQRMMRDARTRIWAPGEYLLLATNAQWSRLATIRQSVSSASRGGILSCYMTAASSKYTRRHGQRPKSK